MLRVPHGNGMKKWSSPSSLSSTSVLVWFWCASRKQHSCLHLYCATTHKEFESSYSARYSGWDDDKAWSSQEWKADELMDDRTVTPVVCSSARTHEFQSRFSREHKHVICEEENHDRTGKPVVCPQRGARPQQFIIGDDEAESELSLGSRSFLDRLNDQVRKRQQRSSMNVTENDEKAFCDMVSVHVCNIIISCIHGKELLRQITFHQKYKRSHNETDVRHI